ncbi:MAG: OadG family protein [Tidjanibacter sp.]|nr:OadG family protein [Tidjanibacter sp.]
MNWSQILWITLIGFLTVFVVLVLLIGIIKLFGVVFAARHKQKVVKKSAEKGEAAPEEVALPEMVTPEVVAAIAMAIRLAAGEDHDRESEILTIQTIKRAYSPWNSKIHGLTRLPERK